MAKYDPSARPSWAKQELEYRKAIKRKLGRREIRLAKRQWVICVETTAITIPGWALAKRDERLSVSEHHVWFRGRANGRAKILARQDKQAGGSPELTAIEWRTCQRCGRLLLNLEAEARRRSDESSRAGRMLPCSGECSGSQQ